MNIIVLGNGFDLVHGLPTRYTDFLKYCRDYDSENMPISNDQAIANEFSESIKDNIWLSYFLKITPNLDEDKTWIDFETEILKVIHGMCPGEWLGGRSQFDAPPTWETLTREEFEDSQFGIFRDYLSFTAEKAENIAAIGYEPDLPKINVEGLYVQLRKFTRAFEIYCCQFINDKCGSVVK